MSRQEVLALIRQKEQLESEIDDTRASLAKHGVTEFDTLLTPDGFPRADLDIPTIRSLRVHLIRKENDLKALLEEISVKLASAFPAKSPGDHDAAQPKPVAARPLGRIRAVLSGTPGDAAGLRADDKVMKFGNATKLDQLSTELSAAMAQQKPIHLVIQRAPDWQDTGVDVLIPRGRSLGCHIVPV